MHVPNYVPQLTVHYFGPSKPRQNIAGSKHQRGQNFQEKIVIMCLGIKNVENSVSPIGKLSKMLTQILRSD